MHERRLPIAAGKPLAQVTRARAQPKWQRARIIHPIEGPGVDMPPVGLDLWARCGPPELVRVRGTLSGQVEVVKTPLPRIRVNVLAPAWVMQQLRAHARYVPNGETVLIAAAALELHGEFRDDDPPLIPWGAWKANH